jgi:hypothetical protein
MLGTLVAMSVLASSSIAQAKDDQPYIEEVRIFDPDFTLPHAAGMAYSPLANIFLLLTDHSTFHPIGESENLTMISPFEDLIGSANLPIIANPINMTFDSNTNRLLLFDTERQELIEIKSNPDGYVDPAAISRYEAHQFNVQNPQGMAVDPVDGTLFILSETNSRIVRIKPDTHGSFNGATALAESRITQIDLSQFGLGPLRGLALNPINGHLYVLNPVLLNLYEVSKAGELVATRDMSILDVGFRDPQGIVFAPSADLTDDPAQMHLFLMDSGLGPLSTESSGQRDNLSASQSMHPCLNTAGQDQKGPGRIIEFNLTQSIENPLQQGQTYINSHSPTKLSMK